MMWRPKIPKKGGPLHARITDAIALDIAEARLAPGTRLPPQRDLAFALQTTVATVTRSYAEARRRGLVEATVGRGTFVKDLLPDAPATGPIDLTVNVLPPRPFAGELLASFGAFVDRAASDALMLYQPHVGHERHRAAGARWVRDRGVPAEAADVVVTAGGQHAMLVALATLTAPGDALLVEALTYTGVKSLANHLHLRLVPVELDAEGLMPDALARAAARSKSTVLYVMPTISNPTGCVMSAARRREVLAVAARHELTIIEDDQYGFLTNEAPLAAVAPERCCYINSVSKALVAGVRVGFLRAPAPLIPRLDAAVFASAVMAPAVGAELVTRWIADGTARRILDWKRDELNARQQIARRTLGWKAPVAACPHVWLPLGPRLSPEDFVEQARLRGVLVSPSSVFAVGSERPPHAVRVCLGPPSSRVLLERGVNVLREVLNGPQQPQAAVV